MNARLRVFAAKMRGLFAKPEAREHVDAELNDEIRAHLAQLTERYIAQGMSADDAAAAARRQFGNITLLAEDGRERRTFSTIENLWRDIRYGARQLRRNPLFTTVAIATLAIGIGANTAVFSLLDQLVLRLLLVKDPSHI